jgi:hypothetical protein
MRILFFVGPSLFLFLSAHVLTPKLQTLSLSLFQFLSPKKNLLSPGRLQPRRAAGAALPDPGPEAVHDLYGRKHGRDGSQLRAGDSHRRRRGHPRRARLDRRDWGQRRDDGHGVGDGGGARVHVQCRRRNVFFFALYLISVGHRRGCRGRSFFFFVCLVWFEAMYITLVTDPFVVHA